MTTNDFIRQYKNSGQFNYHQMEEIRGGFAQGLTIDQVKVYAKPEFNSCQMDAIRQGFKMGLLIEQVKLYAKPEFDWQRMWEIRDFIKENNNLPINTIKFLIGLNCI